MEQPPPSPTGHRRSSLSLSQLEVPITPTQTHSTAIEQIHASSSATSGLTSFYLGSPQATTPEPLSFNKLYSKVKSVAAGVREAVREAVVVGGPTNYRSDVNDSRESFESLSMGNTSNKASPTTSNFNFRRPKRLSLSNASIMSRVSTGSGSGNVGGEIITSPLRKMSMIGPSSKSITSPSLAQVTVFRDGTGMAESNGGEGSGLNKISNMAPYARRTIAAIDSPSPSPAPEELIFSNRYTPLQDEVEGHGEGLRVGGDGAATDGSKAIGDNSHDAPTNERKAGDLNTISNSSPQLLSNVGFQGAQGLCTGNASHPHNISTALGSNTSLQTPHQTTSNARLGSPKRKDSTGGISHSKSKRPKASKRTSESLLPGFTINSESDTDEDEYNTSSLADNTSIGLTTNGQRSHFGKPQRPFVSALSGVGGVRAIAGWFGVGGSSSDIAESDKLGNGATAATPGNGANVEAVGLALQQLKKGNLSKDFWMKDENCKDCFLCGRTFTAFRRKHHCRLCGQIFCSKCTSTISGERFSYSGSMRVCNQCLQIVESYKDEPDLTHEEPISHTSGTVPGDENTISSTFNMPTAHRPAVTPLMAIPATRTKAGSNPNRRSAILEFNTDPSPPRPTSARSMKAQIVSSRPMTAASFKHSYQHNHNHHPHPHHAHYHKHNHSRSLHRWPGHNPNDRAPFHRNPSDDMAHSMNTLPAFHTDSIIDPELAPYMSDQDATDDEEMSIFATIAPRHPEASFGTSLSNGQYNTTGDKSLHSNTLNSGAGPVENKVNKATSTRSGGSGMIAGSAGGEVSNGRNSPHTPTKPSKRIQPYVGPQARPITRGKPHRGIMRQIPSGADIISSRGNLISGSPRTHTRSSSIRGGALPPSVELNTASLQHVRNLLKQLLQDANIQDVEKWEQALMPILLKSTDDLNPDIRAGDVIDIRHYIKVKRIPGGKQKDTSYISGVVFTKNLALKSMQRVISQPRIVIITFPIEYQRSQQFMSLEPVIAQEKEFLQNMVNRIIALKPTLLLVGENVSGLALQYLSAANIATAYHVKHSVIEAVARCAQADVFSSVDKLALPLRIGRCAKFEVKTFVHDDIPNRKKTFMFLSGCAKELGCTIVLRGADIDTLAIIKQITEMMVYVVYNLKLETCLMRDEFVQIPSTPRVAVPDTSPQGTSAPSSDSSMISGNKINLGMEGVDDSANQDQTAGTQNLEVTPTKPPEKQISVSEPAPSYYEDMVRKHETKILSASPFVKYMQPYLLTRARELEKKLIYLRSLKDRQVIEDKGEQSHYNDSEKPLDPLERPPEKFELIKPEMVHGDGKATKGAQDILRAIHDVEYDKALHVYETQKRHWENYLAQYDDLFDPYAHQNIVVLYTMVCTVTSVPCEGPEIRRLVFYDQGIDWPLGKSDCTLGQYIEYLCDTASDPCTAGRCDKKMYDHHRSYVHGQARVSVLVNAKMAAPASSGITMWSYCKICPNTNTPAMPMSESTWKYSFAKYLELAFWSSELKLRSGICPHDLSRDHVKCFGYRGKTVVFQYDPIELLEIFVPRTRITYKPELDLKVKNDQYLMYEDKINRYIGSVRARLQSINVDNVASGKHEACKAEIERLLGKLDEEQSWLIAKLQEKYTKSKYYEIIPMNRAMRAMQEKILDWDQEFAAFENNFLYSEKDIRRLAALRLRQIFLDRTTPQEEITPSPEKDEAAKASSVDGTSTPLDTTTSPIDISLQATQDALASVIEEETAGGDVQEKVAGQPDKEMSNTQSTSVDTKEVTLVEKEADVSVNTEQGIPLSGKQLKEKASELISGAIPNESNTPPKEASSNSPTLDSPKSKSFPAISDFISPEISKVGDIKPTVSPAATPPSSTGGGPRRKSSAPPPFGRTHSVPAILQARKLSDSGQPTLPQGRKPSESGATPNTSGHPRSSAGPVKKIQDTTKAGTKISDKPKTEKKLADRLRFSNLTGKKAREKDSMIPRSVPNKLQRRDTKVSNLTKHFEQLSREFEKEKAREKKQLAAKRTKVYPVASTKPIVEVYHNVADAVEEIYEDEEPPAPPELPRQSTTEEPELMTESTDDILKTESPEVLSPHNHSPPVQAAHDTHDEEAVPPTSQPHSDVEESDAELFIQSDHESASAPSESQDALPAPQLPLDSELKEQLKHERSSWMQTLSTFWAERSASGWPPLDYPLSATDHIFADSDVIVREDEPSSLIAFTLRSSDYVSKLASIREEGSSVIDSSGNTRGDYGDLERSMLKTTGTHIKYQFSEGTAKMFCKVFYAEQFDALRKNCGVEDRFAESLSRCTKWDSKGGKSKSVFLKTLDDRIIMKALQPVETAAFLKFAPAYFRFMSEAFFHELPTVIAKMLGFYQIFIKNPTTGTDIKWDVLVMENLFYDRKTTRIFDLKGSMRNRYTHATGNSGEVLLDENMVEFIYETPLFVREHAKKLLRASLWNDTLFLAKQNVMDYSLMIGLDEGRKELVVGIIDCIRTFTWDKKLESWVKDLNLTGGGRNIKPTVTSPKEYKHRFREAMERYILEAPNCWHLFRMSWMSPVQVRLGANNLQSKDANNMANNNNSEVDNVDGGNNGKEVATVNSNNTSPGQLVSPPPSTSSQQLTAPKMGDRSTSDEMVATVGLAGSS